MPTVQSSYSETIRLGFAGMVADSELTNIISRTLESATLGFGQPVLRGAADHGCVLASQETLEVVAAAAQGSNTGNGTMGAVTVTSGAKLGTYTLRIIEPAANAGAFVVEDPDGVAVGHGNVASAYSAGGLAFTLADGATDFVAGDSFTIPVTATSGTNVGNILGISVRDITLVHTTADRYEQYDSVAIMTRGLIWVTAGATLTPDDPVYWNPSTGRFTKTTTHLAIPRAQYDSSAVNGGLILLALGNRLV